MKIERCPTYLAFLREAREVAQRDSEDFDALIQAFERIGAMEQNRLGNGLGSCREVLLAIAKHSPLSVGQPSYFHASAERLFELVRQQRNDAIHQGIIARNLVRHAVEFALILEHALTNMENVKIAADLMVRDVCFAQLDHPMSYVRQRMLVSAFSFLPVVTTTGAVKILSDAALAKWLRQMDWTAQKKALVLSLRDVIGDAANLLELAEPEVLSCDTPLPELVKKLTSMPVLLHHPEDKGKIVGLISAFDLL